MRQNHAWQVTTATWCIFLLALCLWFNFLARFLPHSYIPNSPGHLRLFLKVFPASASILTSIFHRTFETKQIGILYVCEDMEMTRTRRRWVESETIPQGLCIVACCVLGLCPRLCKELRHQPATWLHQPPTSNVLTHHLSKTMAHFSQSFRSYLRHMASWSYPEKIWTTPLGHWTVLPGLSDRACYVTTHPRTRWLAKPRHTTNPGKEIMFCLSYS
jgi:hypothetical protein